MLSSIHCSRFCPPPPPLRAWYNWRVSGDVRHTGVSQARRIDLAEAIARDGPSDSHVDDAAAVQHICGTSRSDEVDHTPSDSTGRRSLAKLLDRMFVSVRWVCQTDWAGRRSR